MDYGSKLVFGVDVAGRKGTTYCLASVSSSGIRTEDLPCNAKLGEEALCNKPRAAIAIDAQLS